MRLLQLFLLDLTIITDVFRIEACIVVHKRVILKKSRCLGYIIRVQVTYK